MHYSDLWGDYPYWWHHWYHDHLGHPAYEHYFIFIEEAEPLANIEGLDGPGGSRGDTERLDPKAGLTRYRASGVRIPEFLGQLDQFPDDLSMTRDPGRRAARGDQLRAYFERRPVHLLDIFIGDEDSDARAIAAAFAPTSWLAIAIGPASSGEPARIIWHAPSPPIAGEAVATSSLLGIGMLPPPLELRLRDIFSLNHIGDADLGAGGAPPPAPDDDPSPDLGKADHVEIDWGHGDMGMGWQGEVA